jgi:hypothetical protein
MASQFCCDKRAAAWVHLFLLCSAVQKANKHALLESLDPVQHVSKGISKGTPLLTQVVQIMLICSFA